MDIYLETSYRHLEYQNWNTGESSWIAVYDSFIKKEYKDLAKEEEESAKKQIRKFREVGKRSK